jgi:uncharacterized protein (DUF433 family)
MMYLRDCDLSGLVELDRDVGLIVPRGCHRGIARAAVSFRSIVEQAIPSDLPPQWGIILSTATEDKADLSRITVLPGQRSGQPCIRGLRVTVWDVLDWLADGMTQEEILDDYPYLEKADFPAVYACAS